MEFKRMTLEALPIEVEDPEIAAMRQSLAKKAKTILGYGLLENYVQQKTEQKNSNSLVQTLTELEIKPLDIKEVRLSNQTVWTQKQGSVS